MRSDNKGCRTAAVYWTNQNPLLAFWGLVEPSGHCARICFCVGEGRGGGRKNNGSKISGSLQYCVSLVIEADRILFVAALSDHVVIRSKKDWNYCTLLFISLGEEFIQDCYSSPRSNKGHTQLLGGPLRSTFFIFCLSVYTITNKT